MPKLKIGKQGSMNLDFSETYDQENDTYYVTFKTGEPSYCIEVDDVILLEMGMFSNLPTGFRILNFAKNKVKRLELKVLIKNLQDSLRSVPPPRSEERRAAIEQALEKVFA